MKFDDVSFMTSRRFYGKTYTALSGDRKIDFALAITQVREVASGAPGTLRGTMRTWTDT